MASCIEILGNEFIPLLQRTTTAATECLRDSLTGTTKNEKLHIAAYAFFMALAEYVPFMFGRAALRAVLELSYRSAAVGFSGEAGENRTQLLQLAATKIDTSVLLETAQDTWLNAVKQGPSVCRRRHVWPSSTRLII